MKRFQGDVDILEGLKKKGNKIKKEIDLIFL